jgi:hypothetical protein
MLRLVSRALRITPETETDMRMSTIPELLKVAVKHHQAGELPEEETGTEGETGMFMIFE